MEDFKERMCQEHNELRERLGKLNVALCMNGFREKVGDYQFKLMKEQALGMEKYFIALTARMKDMGLFPDDEGTSCACTGKFRIKPEPKFRPFKDAEECWTEMQKHQPFGWVKDYDGSKFTIETVYSDNIYVSDEGTCSFDEVFKKFKFSDGTPFGIIDKE